MRQVASSIRTCFKYNADSASESELDVRTVQPEEVCVTVVFLGVVEHCSAVLLC